MRHKGCCSDMSLPPLPLPLVIGMGMMSLDPSKASFEEKIKKIVWEHTNPISEEWNAPCFVHMYSARIWEIIKEALAENERADPW